MGTQTKPSEKYKDVAKNTLASVSGYWKNKDFTTAEGYASVQVIDSVDGKAEIDDFMNYLCQPGDTVRDVETMGKWNVIPQTIDVIMGEGFDSTTIKEIESPKTQPISTPVPEPKLPPATVSEESKQVPVRESLIPPAVKQPSSPVVTRISGGGGGAPSRIVYTTSTNFNGYEQVREEVMNRFL